MGKGIAINECFFPLKMIKCRRQATDLQKLKKLSTIVFSFLLAETVEKNRFHIPDRSLLFEMTVVNAIAKVGARNHALRKLTSMKLDA